MGAVIAFVIRIDILAERREIERFLRIGGARVTKFRWKPFTGLFGIDRKSKHYEVTFTEHTGAEVVGIFTLTAGLGVMMTSKRIISPPHG